jgi:hypothetical protein
MKIDNLRYGFACNSSSTHSVVLYSKKDAKGFSDDLCEDGEFGLYAGEGCSSSLNSWRREPLKDRRKLQVI